MAGNRRETGVVKWFNDKRGYGFISCASGDDLYVHQSSIVAEGFRSLTEGDRVDFFISRNDNGKEAVDVRVSAAEGIELQSLPSAACTACKEPITNIRVWNGQIYCAECHAELAHGIILPLKPQALGGTSGPRDENDHPMLHNVIRALEGD